MKENAAEKQSTTSRPGKLWAKKCMICSIIASIIIGIIIGVTTPALDSSGDDHENDASEITRFRDEAFQGEL